MLKCPGQGSTNTSERVVKIYIPKMRALSKATFTPRQHHLWKSDSKKSWPRQGITDTWKGLLQASFLRYVPSAGAELVWSEWITLIVARSLSRLWHDHNWNWNWMGRFLLLPYGFSQGGGSDLWFLLIMWSTRRDSPMRLVSQECPWDNASQKDVDESHPWKDYERKGCMLTGLFCVL